MKKIAIVGKPNVGKSTLFNRLIESKKAIVDDQPGITRDRNYAVCNWVGRQFQVIDTGGVIKQLDQPFQDVINKQVDFAIKEADLIIFLVSNKEGIDNNDIYISKLLKKQKDKKILLVVNKSENNDHSNDGVYYSLKFGNFFYVSAEHGIGVGDMLDAIVLNLNAISSTSKQEDLFRFCIIGRPNVGKSSLVNTLLGDERVIVSPIANTTRDSIDCDFKCNSKKYSIIDTAGIRRKGKITNSIDKYAYLRVQQSIARSNLVILMLGGSEDFNEQDQVIGGLAHEANIPTIIVVNKWDKVEKDNTTMEKFKKLIYTDFNYLSWAPILFISAKENRRVNTIFDTIEDIRNKLQVKVSTKLLNEIVSKAQILNPPPKFKGARINISFASQVKSQIPTFVLFSNDPKFLHFSYARYMENQIRQAFDLTNVPITIYFKDKNSRIRGE